MACQSVSLRGCWNSIIPGYLSSPSLSDGQMPIAVGDYGH